VDTQHLLHIQTGAAVGVLAILWLLETWLPLFVGRPHRYRHAFRNLVVGAINMVVTGIVFAAVAASVAAWAERAHFGLLHQFYASLWSPASSPGGIALAAASGAATTFAPLAMASGSSPRKNGRESGAC
jgi:hypothetical protein